MKQILSVTECNNLLKELLDEPVYVCSLYTKTLLIEQGTLWMKEAI